MKWLKWLLGLSGPKTREYVNDWYYWDNSSRLTPVLRLDVVRMVNSQRFKDQVAAINKWRAAELKKPPAPVQMKEGEV